MSLIVFCCICIEQPVSLKRRTAQARLGGPNLYNTSRFNNCFKEAFFIFNSIYSETKLFASSEKRQSRNNGIITT